MSETIFDRIVAGEIPSYKVWENQNHLAFLDINPLAKGHTLVIPKQNIGDYIFELKDEAYLNLLTAAKEVAQLLKQKLTCDRILVIVEGFEVPHVHIHLIPAQKNRGLTHLDRLDLSADEFTAIQQQITSTLGNRKSFKSQLH